jgi:hypothetical protein
MIKVNDFVVLTEKSNGLEVNSVGFVEEVKRTKAKVFFIGKLKEVDIEMSKIRYPLYKSNDGRKVIRKRSQIWNPETERTFAYYDTDNIC